MATLFSNGKKVVKFFLRLLPIFIVCYFFISSAINHSVIIKGTDITINDSNYESKSLANFDYFNKSFSFYNYSLLYYGRALGFNSVIDSSINFIISGYSWGSQFRALPQYNWVTNIIYILFYELYISFAFLIFDVFNYIFTIAERFLNKEERLSEK